MVELSAISLLMLSTYTLTSPSIAPRQLEICQAQYQPFSAEAKLLFETVAYDAGVPKSWAYSSALHHLLKKESEGWVGIPNYSIKNQDKKPVAKTPELWDAVHQKIRKGETGGFLARSTATGLGQLVAANVDRYYPSGREGIGDCREEAVGMLRYIRTRYGSPNTAWSCHGKFRPESCPWKSFREGY